MKPVIAYALNAEGLGHAARALVLAPLLLERYRLTFYSSQGALDLVKKRFSSHPDCQFVEIPSTGMIYCRGRISLWRSVLRYLLQLLWIFPRQAERVSRLLVGAGAIAVISDFEPILVRAANHLDLPVFVVSHQHALVAFDMRPVGFSFVKRMAFQIYMRLNTPQYSGLIISSFFNPGVRKLYNHSLVVGGLLRDDVLNAECGEERSSRPLVYLHRSSACEAVLEALQANQIHADVFGLDQDVVGTYSCLVAHERSQHKFVSLLAAAPYVICAPGHQLLCEAIELRKPVLSVVEVELDEQMMNAYMLQAYGFGLSVRLDEFGEHHLLHFISNLPGYRMALDRRCSARGNPEVVVDWLNQRLSAAVCA